MPSVSIDPSIFIKYIPYIGTWTGLLHRASRDGWAQNTQPSPPQSLDDYAFILMVAETIEGYVFGGYVQLGWSEQIRGNVFLRCNSFNFALNSKFDSKPCRAVLKQDDRILNYIFGVACNWMHPIDNTNKFRINVQEMEKFTNIETGNNFDLGFTDVTLKELEVFKSNWQITSRNDQN
jgi:hypothetical protein